MMTKLQELQSYWSDFHKDYYGSRPRGYTYAQVQDPVWLQEQIDKISSSMAFVKETFSGREMLREQGWIIEETDSVYIQQAKWLKEERDRERAEWMK